MNNLSEIVLPYPEQEANGVISDDAGHTLPYVIRLAQNPQSSRTLLILHGRGANERPAKFIHSDWNIICPLDKYGERGAGAWWLGENGDFFIARLLHTLVKSIRMQIGKDRGLYIWGSSMGGYGAILHGCLLRAHAVYAHIPQIRLRGTKYTDGRTKPLYDAVLGDLDQHPYIDLARFVSHRPRSGLPLFLLSQNRFDYPLYLEQHCLYFVNALQKAELAYGLKIDPFKGHTLRRHIPETIQLFDEFASHIHCWRKKNLATQSGNKA